MSLSLVIKILDSHIYSFVWFAPLTKAIGTSLIV